MLVKVEGLTTFVLGMVYKRLVILGELNGTERNDLLDDVGLGNLGYLVTLRVRRIAFKALLKLAADETSLTLACLIL